MLSFIPGLLQWASGDLPGGIGGAATRRSPDSAMACRTFTAVPLTAWSCVLGSPGGSPPPKQAAQSQSSVPLHMLLPGCTMLVHFVLNGQQPRENHSTSRSSVKCPNLGGVSSLLLCTQRKAEQNRTKQKCKTKVLSRLWVERSAHYV